MCYGQIALGTARYRARKSHGRCEWCGEPILAGESYYRTRIFDDAGPFVAHVHVECRDAMARSLDESEDHCLDWSAWRPRGKTQSEHDATKGGETPMKHTILVHTSEFRGDHSADVVLSMAPIEGETVQELVDRLPSATKIELLRIKGATDA